MWANDCIIHFCEVNGQGREGGRITGILNTQVLDEVPINRRLIRERFASADIVEGQRVALTIVPQGDDGDYEITKVA
jgi:hypothetical protein